MNQELAILLSARDQASRVFNQVGASAQQLSQHLNQGLGGAIRGLGSIAGAPARALGGLVDVFGRIGLAGLGITEAFEGIKGALEGLVEPALGAQKRQAQLNAVLTSTGGVAGVTADAANELATSLSKVTTFSAGATLETENLLLTFTNIGKDIFPQVTETALNMATALGEDTKSAAIQLGKALQDPVLGITALRRVGVNFSDAQKEVVKQMVASGDAAGAQALILKELQTEFGNSARAAGQTFAGQLQILSNEFEHLKVQVGTAIIPILTDLMQQLTPIIEAFAEAVPEAIEKARAVLESLGESFASVWQVLQPFAAGLLDIAETLAGGDFQGALGKASDLLNGLVDSISGWVSGDGPGQIRDALLGLADSAWQWLQTAAGQVGDVLEQNVVIPIKNWVAVGGLTRLEGSLLGLAAGAWSWLQGVAGQAAEFLDTNVIQPVKEWVKNGGIGKVAGALVDLAAGAWEWIKGAASTAAGFLDTNVLQPVKDWVKNGGPGKVAGALITLADQAWDWLKGAVKTAATFLDTNLIQPVKDWVTKDGIGKIAGALAGLADSAWSWITEAATKASEFLGHLADEAKKWVDGGGLGNMVTALSGLAAAAWDWVLKAKDTAIEKLGGLADGVQKWIDAGGPGLVAQKLLVLADKAWEWVLKAKDIAIEKLGGLVEGVAAWVKAGGIQQVADTLTALALQAWDWVKNAVQFAATNLGPIVTAVAEWVTKTGIPGVVEASKPLGQAMVDGMNAGVALAIKVGNLQPAIYALQARLEDVRIPENVTKTWEAWGDILRIVSGWVNAVAGSGGAGGGGLGGLLALKQKVDDFFGKAGFQLIGSIVTDVKNLSLAIEAVLSGINRLVTGKDTFAQAIQDIGTILKNTIDPIGFFQMGVNIIEGLINGITSRVEFLKTTVQTLGQALPQWLKDILHISSPSQVMFDIGVQIGQGLALGINAEVKPVFDAAGHLMNGVLSQVNSYGDKIASEVSGILADLAQVGGAGAVGIKPPPPGGASGTPHPGGGPPSLGALPTNNGSYYPNPATAPYTGPSGPMRPGFTGGPTVNGPYGPYIPQLEMAPTNNFYGDNYFTGPSMLDALSTLSEMTR